ncbi:unnamed protein product [Symbiodinium natans]|uniref:Uncharacterized protein n=1 Tax=Symbiodinium natans TaxID=878477 RepID=A0A812K584_9DINO|nr:unnamed protein product [Symbiodinium natans]
MAYREPSVLAFSGTNGPHPTFYKEDPEQALRLFKVWDAKSLLLLRPGPLPDDRLTRVFGAWKSPGQDRQIGDRRGPNSYEAKIGGPSKELPTGALITRVSVQRYTHCLRGSAVDRRDFYHQACVTRSKAFANAVGPAFALRDFEGLAAHADFLAWAEGQNRSAGNHPSCRPRPILVDPDTPVHGCFASLFQGDAAGVEYATAAHAGRLVSGSPVAPDGPWLGLVIDDLFAIASTSVAAPAGPEPPPDEGEKLLRQAKLEYGKAGIAGSDAKDIFGQTVFTVAGAQELCGMLTGSWISCLLYRQRQELVLLSALAPLMVSNVAVPFCEQAYASDASLAKGGHVIGPIVDLSCSPEFDIEQTHVLEWILFLLQSGRLKAVMIEPPCTTFSGPARPCLRTYAVPEGFDRTFPRTWRGNRQAFFAIVIFVVAWRAGAPALVEQPRTSKMRRTKAWQYALSLTGVEENFLASCAYGSPFRKEFALLGTGLNLSRIHRRCPRDHHHVRIEGSFAKSSTAYHPEVAKAFASIFHEAINSKPGHARSRAGLQGLLANDVLSAFAWKTKAAWAWKRPEHINVLATRAFTRGPRDLTLAGGDLRYAHIVDSAVALGAVSKGRSSARTLKPALKASAAIQVAGGIYPGLHFGPTRLNTADAPTRDLELPVGPAVAESIPSGCSTNDVLDFDGTLGFPGEGPTARQTGLDVGRQERRASRPLPLGRPVLDRTRQNRDALILAFSSWLRERGIQLQDFLFGAGFDIEQLNNALVSYGRELYDLGKPYWHYSETVNAISALKPSVRRQLQAAWDTAFSWLAMEPYTHHVPMPPVILLAMLTVCLMWGWVAEAGLFAMSWGGLLRIGEATSARRKQLILPVDVLHVQSFILLQILEPKTRLPGARHQAAKIERSDLIDVIQLAFEFYDPEQRLWPFTNQTLRRRFDAILERLDIRRSSSGARPLDLGSFRPGGATHMLQCCEDSERVRRRGRWASPKVMEIYLQEVASSTFFPSLDLRTRELVYGFAQAFSSTLDQSLTWRRLGLPPSSWYALFLHSSK